MKIKISLCLLVLFSFFRIQSQTCCSGGIPLSNNLGMPLSDKGTFQVGLNYDYNNLNTLNTGTENLNDDSRLRVTHSALFNLGYSITDRLSAEILLTWINQRRKISQFGNENLDQSTGIGDAILLIKYNFPKVLGDNSSFNLGLGSKIPLGSSKETNDIGVVLNSDLQPGSNAWDIIYYSLLSKQFGFNPAMNFYSRIFYRNTGTNKSYQNDLSYRFGNEFQLFLGTSYQFFVLKTLANPGISLKYRTANNDKIDGIDIGNTGGQWIFVVPDLSVNISSNFSLVAKIELPVYSKVKGTQLTPSYRITFGFLKRFIKKQNLTI